MAKKYDVQAIINDLKEKTEMNAEQHDGCYNLMRATIEAYAKLADLSDIDYKDLNLVYLTTVGTWSHGLDAKKKAINEKPPCTRRRQRKATCPPQRGVSIGSPLYHLMH